MTAAVNGSAWAIFHNQGQACIAGSRLVLHERIAEEFNCVSGDPSSTSLADLTRPPCRSGRCLGSRCGLFRVPLLQDDMLDLKCRLGLDKAIALGLVIRKREDAHIYQANLAFGP